MLEFILLTINVTTQVNFRKNNHSLRQLFEINAFLPPALIYNPLTYKKDEMMKIRDISISTCLALLLMGCVAKPPMATENEMKEAAAFAFNVDAS